MNKKKLLKFFQGFLFLFLYLFVFHSSSVFAGDTCDGHGIGSTWSCTSDGKECTCTCHACGGCINCGEFFCVNDDDGCGNPFCDGTDRYTTVSNCCEYDNAPTCGDISVTLHSDASRTPVTCASGLIDVYLTGVSDAETVQFPSWTEATLPGEADGQSDIVWYDAVDQGGGVWKATIDLNSHGGVGSFDIHAYADNCHIDTHQFCSGIEIQKVLEPDCPNPDYVYTPSGLNLKCGATIASAKFSWGDYYSGNYGDDLYWNDHWDQYEDGAALVRPSNFVLRVNHDDPNLSNDYDDPGCSGGTGGCEWMSAGDYWKKVPESVGACEFVGIMGVWGCDATLGATPLSHGGLPFQTGGYLGWSIQAVDACGSFEDQCSVEGDPFACENTAPTCSALTFQDPESGDTLTALYAGVPVKVVSANVGDSADPTNYTWLVGCSETAGSGIINPSPVATGTVPAGEYQDVEFLWTPPPIPNGQCTVKLEVTDTELGNTCARENIILQDVPVTGKIFEATLGNCADIDDGYPGVVAGADIDLTGNLGGSNVSATSAIDDAAFTFNFEGLSGGTEITALTLDENDFADPGVDLMHEIICTPEGFTSTGYSLNGLVNLTGPLEMNIGLRKASVLDGWFNAASGAIYSGSGVSMTTSQAAYDDSAGTLPYSGYMTDDFAFSMGEFNVDTSTGNNSISSRGYARNLGTGGLSFDLSSRVRRMPEGTFTEIDADGFSDLDPFTTGGELTIYEISAGDMNTVLSSGDVAYGDDFSDDGLVIIYVSGDPSSDTLDFEHNFVSGDSNRRILLVSQVPVVVSPDVGIAVPVGDGSDANLEFALIGFSNIEFPSVKETDENAEDSTLVFKGSLITAQSISMERDRGLQNMYPALGVHFDPFYFYTLQKQMLEASGIIEELLGSISVSFAGLEVDL